MDDYTKLIQDKLSKETVVERKNLAYEYLVYLILTKCWHLHFNGMKLMKLLFLISMFDKKLLDIFNNWSVSINGFYERDIVKYVFNDNSGNINKSTKSDVNWSIISVKEYSFPDKDLIDEAFNNFIKHHGFLFDKNPYYLVDIHQRYYYWNFFYNLARYINKNELPIDVDILKENKYPNYFKLKRDEETLK